MVKQWDREWKDKFYIRNNENRYQTVSNLFYDSLTHLIFITTLKSRFIEPILWPKKRRLRISGLPKVSQQKNGRKTVAS